MNVRPASKAGSWYTADATRLAAELRGFLAGPDDAAPAPVPAPVVALMAPHAGYRYSGTVAGRVYARAAVPRDVVVLAVNHAGHGDRAALSGATAWAIPGAEVPVNRALGDAIRARVPFLTVDDRAHAGEHSLELQIPFLHARRPDVRIVPISLSWLDWAQCQALGDAVAAAIGEVCGGEALVVASTDLSHYLPQSVANVKDRRALECVLALDGETLLARCDEEDISMCGRIPTAATIAAARARGAAGAELVDYRTSGDVSGDFGAVVGYAGVLFH